MYLRSLKRVLVLAFVLVAGMWATTACHSKKGIVIRVAGWGDKEESNKGWWTSFRNSILT
jgi:hypothetical protein